MRVPPRRVCLLGYSAIKPHEKIFGLFLDFVGGDQGDNLLPLGDQKAGFIGVARNHQTGDQGGDGDTDGKKQNVLHRHLTRALRAGGGCPWLRFIVLWRYVVKDSTDHGSRRRHFDVGSVWTAASSF